MQRSTHPSRDTQQTRASQKRVPGMSPQRGKCPTSLAACRSAIRLADPCTRHHSRPWSRGASISVQGVYTCRGTAPDSDAPRPQHRSTPRPSARRHRDRLDSCRSRVASSARHPFRPQIRRSIEAAKRRPSPARLARTEATSDDRACDAPSRTAPHPQRPRRPPGTPAAGRLQAAATT